MSAKEPCIYCHSWLWKKLEHIVKGQSSKHLFVDASVKLLVAVWQNAGCQSWDFLVLSLPFVVFFSFSTYGTQGRMAFLNCGKGQMMMNSRKTSWKVGRQGRERLIGKINSLETNPLSAPIL